MVCTPNSTRRQMMTSWQSKCLKVADTFSTAFLSGGGEATKRWRKGEPFKKETISLHYTLLQCHRIQCLGIQELWQYRCTVEVLKFRNLGNSPDARCLDTITEKFKPFITRHRYNRLHWSSIEAWHWHAAETSVNSSTRRSAISTCKNIFPLVTASFVQEAV